MSSERAPAPGGQPALRAIVVDDEQLAREELCYLLGLVGGVQVVAQASDGLEALDVIEEHSPDLVMLDIQMPGLTGFEVARQIRTRYGAASPLLIAISGHFKHGADKVLAEIVGFDYHLAKPCDAGALLTLLNA
jgi:two-component system, LytTR family, response regulator LytT